MSNLSTAQAETYYPHEDITHLSSAKEVALMLVAGSEVVRQIHDRQGRNDAIAFARHITTIASQQQGSMTDQPNRLSRRGLEIGD